jgi:hypothetical protein
MLQSLAQRFTRGAMSVVLLSIVCSGVASAQVRRYGTPNLRSNTPTRLASKYQTPEEQVLIPFVRAHAPQASQTLRTANSHAQASGTNYDTTPQFGGYVNAPNFPAVNTASLLPGLNDFAAIVEVAADFNKDGKTDIADLQEDGTLNILINNGSGGLSAPVSYLNPNYPSTNVFVAYAVDVNGDGYPDIVAYDIINNTTITWLNLGNGMFNAAVTTPLDEKYGTANFAYLADVNDDGKADLIFANLVPPTSGTIYTIYLETQLGKGDGTFGTASQAKVESFNVNVPVGVFLNAQNDIAVGDINGDGKMDIALGLSEIVTNTTGAWVVTTALGNNDGTFTGLGTNYPISIPVTPPPPFYVLDFNGSILAFDDVNGDGKPDLITNAGSSTLETALGNGDGTFSSAVTSDISAIAQQDSAVLLDVNDDGKPDLVVSGGTLGVFLGKGDGTFTPPVEGSQYVTDFTQDYSLVVGDFNSDGLNDVALLGGSYQNISLFSSNGKGGFHGAPVITAENDPHAAASTLLTSGTYTSNGYDSPLISYAGATSTDLVALLSDGKGNFTNVQALPALPLDAEFFEPIHADFNGDGFEDIVYADPTGSVWVALSKGDGTFTTPVSAGFPTAACPVYYGAAADLNGDGKADLVIPYGGDASCGSTNGGPSGYYVALGNGNGTFQAPVFTTTGTELYKLVLGDINADGKVDLILVDDPFDTGTGFQLSYATGNGDGTFNTPNVLVQNELVSDVSIADINNDGKPDLVISSQEVAGTSPSTGGILLITGNGDGTFNTPSEIALGNFFFGIQVKDMNNDGNADIVATLYEPSSYPLYYGGLVTLLGYGNGQFAASYNSFESLVSTLPMVGNFVNDNASSVMTSTAYGPALFIGQGGDTLALTTSASSINFGTAEILTAALTSSLTNRPAATGTVSFYDGTTPLGTLALSSGAATLTVSSLAVGTHKVDAVYSGDANFNPTTSASSTITVGSLAPAFTLSGTPATLSVSAGSTGTATLNLAANATFSGAVTLSCSGMPSNGSCSTNPGSVTLTAGGSSMATLVVSTAGTVAQLERPKDPWGAPAAASSALLLGVFFVSRKRFRMLSVLGIGLIVLFGMTLTGCNGSGNNGSSVPTAKPGTYTVTVTATPASGTAASAQSIQVSVTVN